MTREDEYVYLGYQFRCERREENVTVARAKTGGINDLIMCFTLNVLNEDLVVMRLYTSKQVSLYISITHPINSTIDAASGPNGTIILSFQML